MNKIKVFCEYSRTSSSDLYDSWSDEDFYVVAIAQLTKSLIEVNEINEEMVNEVIELIIFWALYQYGKYTFQKEEPKLDVEVQDLPINMSAKEFKKFKKSIKIVVKHFHWISNGIGKPAIIWMKDFKPFLTRTEKFTMDIPPFWLNT